MDGRARAALYGCALAHAAIGLLVFLSSWDGLYSTLDLPQPKPALFAQIVAPAVFIPAALLAAAVSRRSLITPVCVASGAADAIAALVLAAWLAFRDLDRWGVDALGYTLLGGLLVLLTLLAVIELAVAAAARVRTSDPATRAR
jgi:hypothetical protein